MTTETTDPSKTTNEDDENLADIGAQAEGTTPPPPDNNPVYQPPTSDTGTTTSTTWWTDEPTSGYTPSGGTNTVEGGTQMDPGNEIVLGDTSGGGTGDSGGGTTGGTGDTGGTDSAPTLRPTSDPLTPREISQAAPFTPYQNTSTESRPDSPLSGNAQQFITDWLAAPSRYDMDVVQTSMNAIQSRMDELRRQGYNQGQEYLASMGMLGGTRAGELQDMRRAEYDRQEQDQLGALMREMAMTQGMDRQAALNAVMQMLNFNEGQWQFDQGLGFQRDSLAESSRQYYDQLAEQARMFADELGFRQDQMMEGSRQFNDDLNFRKDAWQGDYNLQNDELDWRKSAEQIRNAIMVGNDLGWDINPEILKKIFGWDWATDPFGTGVINGGTTNPNTGNGPDDNADWTDPYQDW